MCLEHKQGSLWSTYLTNYSDFSDYPVSSVVGFPNVACSPINKITKSSFVGRQPLNKKSLKPASSNTDLSPKKMDSSFGQIEDQVGYFFWVIISHILRIQNLMLTNYQTCLNWEVCEFLNLFLYPKHFWPTQTSENNPLNEETILQNLFDGKI